MTMEALNRRRPREKRQTTKPWCIYIPAAPRLSQPAAATATLAGAPPLRLRTACALRPNAAMSWRSHGTSNASMVKALCDNGIITDPRVRRAFIAVDRAFYVSPSRMTDAYLDAPSPIGYGQTISAPHMHAHCAELLADYIRPDDSGSSVRVLDVGHGSGYLAAIFGQLVGNNGRVIGIERLPSLVALSHANCSRDPATAPLLASGALSLRVGDGWAGCPDDAPFNAIHVGAAAEQVPAGLVSQLARGGRMVIPIGPSHTYGQQALFVVDKAADGAVTAFPVAGVQYVPLVREMRDTSTTRPAQPAGGGDDDGDSGGGGA